MNVGLPHEPFASTARKPVSGCWTCKVRRKKCDGNGPICDACAALHIDCYHDRAKPEWMDGGAKQDEMAERLKCQVKENAHRRRGERSVNIPSDSTAPADLIQGEWIVLPQRPSAAESDSSRRALLEPTAAVRVERTERFSGVSIPSNSGGPNCTLTSKANHDRMPFDRSCTMLVMFYLESVFPFLFPFHQPSVLQGGRAWLLEMMMSSPVVRKALLCQSSYYLSLERGAITYDGACEMVLAQTTDAFEVLREALQVIDGPDIARHVHGAVRIFASIMQLQRVEIAIMSFKNCRAHLSAAEAIFRQLLENCSAGVPDIACTHSYFEAVVNALGPPSSLLPGHSVRVPSAEQVAFRFSSALLISDDIIASTVLQEPPRMYEYHRSLLSAMNGTQPLLDLKATVGCENWVLLQVGETAALDAWKQQSKRAGNLDVMRLVHRATSIKDALTTGLARLEETAGTGAGNGSSVLDVLMESQGKQPEVTASQSLFVTRMWAHAAILYLLVVVSGWQPASDDVRLHVHQIIELLSHHMPSPKLLRTVVWPFCVAGCLAGTAQECHFRGLAKAMEPPSMFGTLHRALDIMETVWRSRDAGHSSEHDLAACFRSQDGLVLLL